MTRNRPPKCFMKLLVPAESSRCRQRRPKNLGWLESSTQLWVRTSPKRNSKFFTNGSRFPVYFDCARCMRWYRLRFRGRLAALCVLVRCCHTNRLRDFLTLTALTYLRTLPKLKL